MNKKLLHQILKIQEKATADPEYLEQLAFFRDANDRLLVLLPQLTPEQEEAVMDMIYYGANLHWRMLALACEEIINAAPQ